jgi:hypothetical protein
MAKVGEAIIKGVPRLWVAKDKKFSGLHLRAYVRGIATVVDPCQDGQAL